MGRVYRQSTLRTGLGSIPFALLFVLLGSASSLVGALGLYFILIGGALAVVGFWFLVASLFLPTNRRAKPTFTEELLGKERMHYGDYTKGNWRAVLAEKDKEQKGKHKSEA